ncbi:hypothetical protein [Streptomyces sp. NBC_01217]|uniref:hypothetical protein n=1 Tax=Streptomyces sp. NBC_01217 TaxID=2903779 RepID=UPI002E16457C|nr:hypothetical protein OG507_20955 [Streptomyces sp. NBC_01217]
MNVPGWLLRHRVIIEPYAGDSAYGPTYGPPVEVAAMVAEKIRSLRSSGDTTVSSTAQIIAAPDINCPPESRITLPGGRITRALIVSRHTAPGLPVPQSTEVICE